MPASREELESVLTKARRFGFLGPGPVGPQIDHAERFAEALREAAHRDGLDWESSRYVDLGAGGGLPSLPILVGNDSMTAVLVDTSQKRCSFLVWAAVELGLSDRVEVWVGRAEAFGHEETRRGDFDAVVARGFGPPAWTIECAAPLLRMGGRCFVSEPPNEREWPAGALERVGLRETGSADGVAVFERFGPVDARFARPQVEQRREPLF